MSMTHAKPDLLRNVQLDDKFAPGPTRVYLTGIDALVRLPLLAVSYTHLRAHETS